MASPGFEGDLPLSPGIVLDGFLCVEVSSYPPGSSYGQVTGRFYVLRTFLIEPLRLGEEIAYAKKGLELGYGVAGVLRAEVSLVQM